MFQQSKLIPKVRKNDRGSHFVIETVKYFFVIFTVTYFANWVPGFVTRHAVKPFASLPGLWNFAMILLAAGAICYCLLWEKMNLRQMGILSVRAGKTATGYLLGLGAGVLMIALVAGVALLIGGYRFASSFSNVKWFSFFVILLSYLIQGLGEEVLFRGAFLLSTVRKNNPIIAILITSAFFSLWHDHTNSYGVIPFINLFLFGAACAVSVFVFDHIWLAGAFHAAWNFAQAHIFGVSVSGSAPDADTTLFTSATKGSSLLSGGEYGMEGSLITSVVLAAAIVGLILYDRKQNAKPRKDAA